MARINIEECWWSDPRRMKLLLKIGFAADSAAVNMWRVAQEFWTRGEKLVPKDVFFSLEYSSELVGCSLATVGEHGVYVRGSSAYFSWLAEKREQAREAGKKSAQRARDEKGRLLPANAQRSSNDRPANANEIQPSCSSSYSYSKNINTYAQPEGFAEFWFSYPRKVGKAKTLKLYQAAIKAGASPKDLLDAQKNYRKYLQENQTEPKHIKHGPTFMADWRDWLDPETGQAEDFSKTSKQGAGGICGIVEG